MKLDFVLILTFFMLFMFFEQGFSQLNVTRINKGDLYVWTDGMYFGMFMVTPKGVIVVDAPPTTAQNTGKTIPQIIANYTSQPIKWVIYSHHHLDHIGAAGAYPKNAEYICHKKASVIIEDESGVPNCTLIVKNDGYNLTIDSKHEIQLQYHGTIHTEGNLYIWVPYYKLLMLVDFVFPQWGPYHSMGMASSLVYYWNAFPNVLAYPFQYYVGGHVNLIGSRNDVMVAQQFFLDLEDSVDQALQVVNYTQILQQNGGFNGTNQFTIYRDYTDALTASCVNTMMVVKGWATKLIDLSAYIDTHCFVMSEHVDINF